MAGLDPAIHDLLAQLDHKDVDARHKAGHDEKQPGVNPNKKAPAKPGPLKSAESRIDQRE
jgi:hypothetical protein